MSTKAKIERVNPREHVLLRPDMYIGSTKPDTATMWLYSLEKGLYQDEVHIVPGLFKIYDEIIVNASDNKQHDPERQRGNQMTYIKVSFDRRSGEISVENDGVEGLLAFNKKENVYVPELAFGILLTSSNYSDDEERVTGGRNGYGAKLTNIYSTRFTVDLVEDGKRYTQTWMSNMSERGDPKIEPLDKPGKNRIKVTFLPDYARFSLPGGLDDAHADLICRRALDIAGCNRNVTVTVNGTVLPVKCFEDYVKLVFMASNPGLVAAVATGDPTAVSNATSVVGKNKKGRASANALKGAGALSAAIASALPTVAKPAKPPKRRKAVSDSEGESSGPDDEASGDSAATAVTKVSTTAAKATALKPQDWASSYIAFTSPSDRWDIAVAYNGSGEFTQMSFVNSISTTEGGTHVECILDALVKPIQEAVNKALGPDAKHAKPLTRVHIRQNILLCIRSLVVNPSFDSQTKVKLRTPKAQIQADLKDIFDVGKFVKAITRITPLMDALKAIAFTQAAKVLTKSDGTKRLNVFDIPKLNDATMAGGRESMKCTLILTEGDSAKALAVEGVSHLQRGREYYGVFPLRGKVLNVRNETAARVAANLEISNLKKILGLKQGADYSSDATFRTLRYGKVMIMADQDTDGSHIKGLLINLFDTYWPSLARRRGFLQEFITPIVRCRRRKTETVSFYTLPEYKQWVEAQKSLSGWDIRYYKGLGSSDKLEAKEYFEAIRQNEKNFSYDGRAAERLTLAFHKKLADARKDWITATDPINTYLDQRPSTIAISDFVDKELVLYEIMANQRAIPSLMDGLKPGQRKIIYACFKRKLDNPIKVSQLSGYVSEHAAYHHGEQSLNGTIVNLAQSFTGANNVPLLLPLGQFGTRIGGGKDSSAARYIRTALAPITRFLFPRVDDDLVQYLEDDGQKIEPLYYVPVIPLVLANGTTGIGSGFSSTVPQFNPFDLIQAIRIRIAGKSTRTERRELSLWYRGWTGTTTRDYTSDGKFVRWTMRGRFSLDDEDKDAIWITELPVGIWTEEYRQQLQGWVVGAEVSSGTTTGSAAKAATKTKISETVTGFHGGKVVLKDVKDYSTNDNVRIYVQLSKAAADALLRDPAVETEGSAAYLQVIQAFRLEDTIRPTNMWLHNENGVLQQYKSASEIIDHFFKVRIVYYERRKKHLVSELFERWMVCSEKARFIRLIIEKELVITNVARDKITELMWSTYRFHPQRADRLSLLKHGTALVLRGTEEGEEREGEATAAAQDDANDYYMLEALQATVEDVTGDAFFSKVAKPSVGDLARIYEYLLGMSIKSMTKERYETLLREADEALRQLEKMQRTEPADLWMRDLSALELACRQLDANIASARFDKKITISDGDIDAREEEVREELRTCPYGPATGESDNEVEVADAKATATRDEAGNKLAVFRATKAAVKAEDGTEPRKAARATRPKAEGAEEKKPAAKRGVKPKAEGAASPATGATKSGAKSGAKASKPAKSRKKAPVEEEWEDESDESDESMPSLDDSQTDDADSSDSETEGDSNTGDDGMDDIE